MGTGADFNGQFSGFMPMIVGGAPTGIPVIEGDIESSQNVALVVDLDGTLVRTDLLFESYFASATQGLRHQFLTLRALFRGKAALKSYLAQANTVDHTVLPYEAGVLELIRAAKSDGRKVFLATASDIRHAEGVSRHLGLFDGFFSSDGSTNLSGKEKADRLVREFGERGFDYVADHHIDIPVWAHARNAYVVGNSKSLFKKASSQGGTGYHIARRGPSIRVWLKAIRIHQYAKNSLVFVPLITAHAYTVQSFTKAILAFVAFSLCASSVYLLNDLVDLNDDRKHPSKKRRPFARGAIPIVHGVIAIPFLMIMAFGCATIVSPLLTATLAAYFVLTLSYSFSLKRKLMVDVIVLAILYTIRVIAGAAALSIAPSEWLLAFSMFIFTCLALVKRYVELAMRIDRALPDPSNRNYRLMDLPTVGALAAASGFNAVTIFALYVSSPAVQSLYHRPQLLWLLCPILLYWIGRIVMLAHRRAIDDDPIVFAIRDRNSIIVGVAMAGILLLASW
jgi:4-hydroxybenzoate polyprenyltransferase/phosphoserine phosphatase